MTYYFHAAKFFLPARTEEGGYLAVQDDGRFGLYYSEKSRPTGPIHDCGDNWVAPGYVDTHIHGLLKEDVMKSNWQGIDKISRGLLRAGVTSWLPTTITASEQTLNRIAKMFGQHHGQETGAKIQGLHFEGPFFTKEHAGAENSKYMMDPNWELFNKWRVASDNLLCKISLAPERKGSQAFIRQAVKSGVAVALGHSSATFGQATRGVEAGASIFTHTFNGMPEPDHHHPSIANAALALHHVTDELICDGHHVQKPMLQAILQAVGPEHIALVTDCMEAGMMPDGDYMLGELPVYVKDGMARLKQGNNLAGSILQLKQAVKNLIDWELATPEQAIMMASYVPAKSVHLLNRCGQIAPDHPADFLILKSDLSLQATYLNGQRRYQAK